MISINVLSILFLFVSMAQASRYGLLRVGVPSSGAVGTSKYSDNESSRLLMNEDFEALYRQLFGFHRRRTLITDFSLSMSMSMSMSMAPSMGSYPLTTSGSSGEGEFYKSSATTEGPSTSGQSNFKAGLAGGLSGVGVVALVVAAVLYKKMKRSGAVGSGQESVVSEMSSLRSMTGPV